ncbi:MAG: acyl-CoA thioesterase [Bacteriovoracaceae bacterium]
MIKATFYIFYYFMKAKPAQEIKAVHVFSRTVMPWHLDLNIHVNNTKYLSFGNQARLVYLAKSKVLNLFLKDKITPVIYRNDITYYKSLKLFDTFKVETTLKEVQNDQVILKHVFMKEKSKMAELTSYIKLFSKEGRIDPIALFNQHYK